MNNQSDCSTQLSNCSKTTKVSNCSTCNKKCTPTPIPINLDIEPLIKINVCKPNICVKTNDDCEDSCKGSEHWSEHGSEHGSCYKSNHDCHKRHRKCNYEYDEKLEWRRTYKVCKYPSVYYYGWYY